MLLPCVALMAAAPTTRAADDDDAFAWRAPIAVERPAAFVELPLDLATYAHLEQPGLVDLRIIDSQGRRVPFAVLPPLRPARPPEVHDGRLYALPPGAASQGTAARASPWTIELQDGRVVMRGGEAGASGMVGSPGWVIDTSLPGRGAADPVATGGSSIGAFAGSGGARTLTFEWHAAAEFTAAYSLDTSDDLKTWRAAGSGQLLSLSSAGDTLAQRVAALPEGHGRFVRLLWREPSTAPRLTGVKVSSDATMSSVATSSTSAAAVTADNEGLTRGEVAPSGAVSVGSIGSEGSTGSTGAAGSAGRTNTASSGGTSSGGTSGRGSSTGISGASGRSDASAATPAGTIDFDLGAVLPLTQIELLLPQGNWVAPIVVQTRIGPTDGWVERTRTVVYRLERPAANGGASTSSRSPAIPMPGASRYIRVITDARVTALDAGATRLSAQARLAHLVFAAQGSAPYALVSGFLRPAPMAAALPIDTLVPALDIERPAFGRAVVGTWTEVEATRERREKERDSAALYGWLRPLLLWAVLLAGVAGLGFMAWRLMRSSSRGS
ncbi:MAG: rane protein [Rhizobacter sp.]|nr:rane protein [Rhizobacter sp.]